MPALDATSLLLFGIPISIVVWADLHWHRSDKPMSFASAAGWSVIWMALAFAFCSGIGYHFGTEKAWLFIAGYVLEQSLSVDNLFVFMAVFGSFGIVDGIHHRVLYYGIVGAVVLRLVFILLGTSLLVAGGTSETLHTLVFTLFGVLVLWSAYQMCRSFKDAGKKIEDYSNHWSVRWTRRFMPVHPRLEGHSFFVRRNGRWLATPLFLCLIVLDVVNVLFSFDSIPAVIAVTREPFLIVTSNVFAILGLRSIYFLLTAARRYLCHIEKAIVAILMFIGCKLLLEAFQNQLAGVFGWSPEISPAASVAVVVVALALGVLISLVFPEGEPG